MKRLLTIIFLAALYSCNETPKTETAYKVVAPTGQTATITLSPGDSVIKIPPSKDTAVIRISVKAPPVTVTPTVTTSAQITYSPVVAPGPVTPPVDTTKPTSGTSVADAGPDQTITIYKDPTTNEPTTMVILGGTKTSGTTFAWEKVSGGDATVPAATKNPSITIKTGTYVYRLKVDNIVSDDVTIKVIQSDLPNAPVNNKVLLYSDFEGALPFQGWITGTQSCKTCPYSFATSTEQKRTGSKSLRFEVRDQADNIVSKKHRSEIIRETGEKEGSEFWYGVSFFLQNWTPDLIAGGKFEPESILQWHHSSSAGSPPLALWVQGNDMTLLHTRDAATDANFNYQKIGKLADWNNKWVDVVLHVKWSSTSSGLIELWINGTKTYTYTGITNYAGSTNYLKYGIYKWPWTNRPGSSVVKTRIMFTDNFRIGTKEATFADVNPAQ